jgi:hypothetical protein
MSAAVPKQALPGAKINCDQNRNEIPLRTSYALTAVEEPPWWFHRMLQIQPPRDDATNEMGEEPICLLVLDGQAVTPNVLCAECAA